MTTEEEQLEMISRYRGIVLKLVWSYWRTLPACVKVWLEPEDLIEDAYVFVVSTAAKQMYDSKRGAESTFVWNGVNNLLLNFSKSQTRKKRLAKSVPLKGIAHLLFADDDGVSDVDIKSCLDQVYDEASGRLRMEMIQWFVEHRARVKWSSESKAVYREFRKAAQRTRLTPNDCRKMLRRGTWSR